MTTVHHLDCDCGACHPRRDWLEWFGVLAIILLYLAAVLVLVTALVEMVK